MKFIALTKRHEPKGHVSVDYDHIVAIEDNRFNTSQKDFAWTNVWLTNGMKLEVLETEREILDIIWRKGQHKPIFRCKYRFLRVFKRIFSYCSQR